MKTRGMPLHESGLTWTQISQHGKALIGVIACPGHHPDVVSSMAAVCHKA